MADLYSILARAVEALDPSTKETRRRLYERARAALVAETHGLARSEVEFLDVLGSLEDAIQDIEAQIEAEAQHERRVEPPRAARPAAPPHSDVGAAAPRRNDVAPPSPRPVKPIARRRFPQVMPFFSRAFRKGRDGARNLLQRPADPSKSLPDDLANEMDFDPPPDNWLSELLERASRAEHENGAGGPLPRRDRRRNR